jgi:hypothetical protein
VTFGFEMQQSFALLLTCLIAISVDAFLPKPMAAKLRAAPLYENFGLNIGEDPIENTPRSLLGEENYRNFVAEYDPNALLNGGKQYNIVERIRELKLLKVTAESGLLEALEKKGLTLSGVEKLLPIIDDFGLLPLISKNKELILSVAPLLIEPAPALLPLLASVLRTPPSTFLYTGLALVGAGGYEVIDNALLLGAPLILLGLPLTVLGAVLGLSVSLPSVPTGDRSRQYTVAGVPEVIGKRSAAPVLRPSAQPRAVVVAPLNPLATANVNGRRKLVKIKSKR